MIFFKLRILPKFRYSQKNYFCKLDKFEQATDLSKYSEILQNVNPEIQVFKNVAEHQLQKNTLVPNSNISGKIREINLLLTDKVNKYKIIEQNLSQKEMLEAFKLKFYLKNPELTTIYISLLHYIAKTRVIRYLNRPELNDAIHFISNRLNSLDEFRVSSFAYSIYSLRVKDELPFKKIEHFLLQNDLQLSLHSISVILYSFREIISKNKIGEKFSNLFKSLEPIIAIKLVQEKFDKVSICQLISIYCITENASNELLVILEKHFTANVDKFSSKEVSVILYSFYKRGHESTALKETAKLFISTKKDSLNIQSLSLIFESVSKSLSDEEFDTFQKIIISKFEYANCLDIEKICSILFQRGTIIPALSSKINSSLKLLKHNLNEKTLASIFSKSAQLYNEGKLKSSFYYTLYARLEALVKAKDVSKDTAIKIRNEMNLVINSSIREMYIKLLEGLK